MSEYEETMGADFCEHDIIDVFATEANSEAGSTRRRSSFGIIRNDGTPRGSLRRRNVRAPENGVGEVDTTSVAPTQIVISTIEGNNHTANNKENSK